jgi:hypothetical protein
MNSPRISPETGNRLLRFAFLAQLVVPLLLVADLVVAWQVNDSLWWYGFGTNGQTVFVLCILWIVLAISLFLAANYAKLFALTRLQGPLVAIYSVVLVVLVIELGLQVIPEGNTTPALWPPVKQALLEPDPKFCRE